MKRLYSILMSAGVMLLLTLQMNIFTSCNDDMPAESYYTFTGEMLDDYLKNREQFSMFRQVVERAGYMNVLHSRGKYVMFPPTNDAMYTYMAEHHYASLNDIPDAVCDTLARGHLADAVGNDYNTDLVLLQMGSIVNWLDIHYLTFEMSGDKVDKDNLPYMIVNSNSNIINTLKNDSCENGMVHPVDRVILPATDLGGDFLNSKRGDISIFYEICRLTGMLEEDKLNRPYEDVTYMERVNSDPSKYPDPWPENIQSGFANEHYRLKRPDRRLQGYTIFAVTDEVFKKQYSIDAADLDAAIDNVYDLAVELYSPVAEDMGITSEDRAQYWKKDKEAYKNPKNPLNMFISYHILDRRFTSLEKFINLWGTNTLYADPTEWVNTMLEHSSMKIERVYQSVDRYVEQSGDYYLNHAAETDHSSRVRGAKVTVPADNLGLNCSLYYVDRILAYDTEMRTNVMNARIRTDFMTLWPELTTNDIRLNGSPFMVGANTYDIDETYPAGKNYYMPVGYLDNVSINDDAIFFVMRPHNTFYGWGGDEINFLGPSYDVTFRIPSLPSGNYEVRIGISGGHDTRGVAQIYFDGRPQGIPIDMRLMIDDPSIGGKLPADLKNDDEAIMENNQTLKNNGFYRGPRSMFHIYGGAATKYQTPPPVFMNGEMGQFDNIRENYRIVICKVDITGDEYHTIRVRSVYSSANGAAFMLDYLELVPSTICGVDGFGEDLY